MALAFWSAALMAPNAQAMDSPVVVSAVGPMTDPESQARFVGVRFTLAADWHVYWLNPGDIGQAPTIAIEPAKSVGDVLWPCPERLDTPPLASYGYSQTVVLPVPLHDASRDLTAKVTWLACQKTCVPGSAEVHWRAADLQKTSTDAALAESLGRVPQALPQNTQASFASHGDTVRLGLESAEMAGVASATFFPRDRGGVDENYVKTIRRDARHLTVDMTAGSAWRHALTFVDGVLELTFAAGDQHVYAVHAAATATPLADAPVVAVVAPQSKAAHDDAAKDTDDVQSLTAFVQALVLACLGGMLLNLMPCVFPVLSIKVMAYIQTSGDERDARRRQALWYALGNVTSLTSIGAALLGLRAMGQQVGWGFQMQSPLFVMAMALLMFVLGANQMGWVSFGQKLMGLGQHRARGHSDGAAFFTGVLTVVVATPCSAPFMGVATGAALSLPPWMGLGVFAAVGLGVALPYLGLCYIEPLAQALPRPGLWMVRLREATGLCLWGSCIWLLWIVGLQRGTGTMTLGLVCCLITGAAIWVHHTWRQGRPRTYVATMLVIVALGTATWACTGQSRKREATPPLSGAHSEAWRPYDAAHIEALRAEHRGILVDFTAAWCVSCQINEALVLRAGAVEALLDRLKVIRIKADWTDHDDDITDALARFGRNSVPLYVYYPTRPERRPIVLPAVLTTGVLTEAIQAAEAP